MSAASVQIHCLSPRDRFLASLHPVGIDLGINLNIALPTGGGPSSELGGQGARTKEHRVRVQHSGRDHVISYLKRHAARLTLAVKVPIIRQGSRGCQRRRVGP